MIKRTQVLKVDPLQPDPDAIGLAAQAIAGGKLVAFPTETVYGLGANALDARAVDRIFTAKQRPLHDPLIVHLADAGQIDRVAVAVPDVARELAERFWPGALTLVLRRRPEVPLNVTAGGETVAARVPAHPVARALLQRCGLPIAAPSANLFSRPSPTTARHVLMDLDGRIDLVLDGGPTPIGLESTVVDVTCNPPRLLRPGGVSVEALREVVSALIVPASPAVFDEDRPAASPGTLLKHYSPRAPVVLLRGEASAAAVIGREAVRRLRRRDARVGVLVPDEEVPLYADLPATVLALGPGDDPAAVARTLFARLRDLDAAGVDVILAREVARTGLGHAICDRLFRAAEGRVIEAGRTDDLDHYFDRVLAERAAPKGGQGEGPADRSVACA